MDISQRAGSCQGHCGRPLLVHTKSSHLIKNRTEVVVTNEVRFERTAKNMKRGRITKANSVAQAIYSQAREEFEIFKAALFGLYILKRDDVPTSDCEMARTLWTSDAADIYLKKKGVPKEVADIIRVGGRNNSNEAVSLALKDSTTIFGWHTRRTAIKEIFMLELHDKDDHLDIPPLHPGDSTQFMHIKSVIMSTASRPSLP